MTLDIVLGALAAFVHANLAIVSVASALVILGLLFGDAEDFILFGFQKGWRKLVSLTVALNIIGADVANETVAGVAALAFLGALGAGASYKAAGLTALVAIGTVNTAFLLGSDRAKLLVIIGYIRKPASAPAAIPRRT